MIKPVLILAGGFGTRLKSAVPDLPKPLAPVKGRPFLLYLLDNLINQGARTFIILLHHQAELIKSAILEYIDQSETLSLSVKFVIEKEPLGTGGAINNAIKIHSLTGSFIVLNGDTWLSGGLEKINNSPINSIAAVKIEDTSRYGALCLSDSFVVSFREKVFSDRAGYINAGMYHLEPKIFSRFRANDVISLEKRVISELVNVRQLHYVIVNAQFIDIGIPEDYEQFCSWVGNGMLHES